VILADEDFRMGGRLNSDSHLIDDQPGADWASTTVAELSAMPNIRLRGKPRQVLWRIYSKRAVLAAGATERSIAFGNNDRPGVMLSGAVRTYVNRFGAAPGRNVAIFCNNDDGLQTATALETKGVEVTAVIDARKGETVVDTKGRKELSGITLNNGRRIKADCLAVSGGWSPNVHLTCHHRGRPVWREDIAGFVPGDALPPGMTVIGAANGEMTLGAGLREGHAAGLALIAELGYASASDDAPKASDEPFDTAAFWHVSESKSRAWVDLQNDVTTKDIKQSHAEGFRAVEHLKRYTTLGMATDQGKTANILGLALMADASGKSIPETGTTIFRPPYNPVAIGAFAGRSRGKDFRPTRLTPSHDWAQQNGADFVEAGLWKRAQWFKQPGEKGWRDSVDREVMQTRNSVGICDVTTLGKIDIQGRDAAEFLNHIYANAFLKLAVGKVRYGLMLREDGVCYDDGTTARLGEHHFVMTTTTANAVTVFRDMEFARQCLWPDLDVHLISTTDAWAQFAVAGPNSRALLQKVVDDIDLSNEAFPFMACTECSVFGGATARLFRISFSGELAFEIAVPARYGDSMIRGLMAAGEEFAAVPYGTEALGVMRIERGHAAGNELNGQTSAQNLGLGAMVSKKKDAIGSKLSERKGMNAPEDLRLVGFKPVDLSDPLKAGAHFLRQDAPLDMAHDQGWMTSVAYSPELGHSIGLGFLKEGSNRMGEQLRAYSPVQDHDILVQVCSPHHIDPEGARQRG